MSPRRVVTALAALVLAAAAALAVLPRDEEPPGAPAAAAAPQPGAKPAAFRPQRGSARRSRALGPTGVVTTDRRTGGVHFAGRVDSFLTGPREGDPADIALRYVARHREVFGLDRRDLARLRPAGRTSGHGVTVLRWRQEVAGVPLLEGSLQAAVTDDGRLVNVSGGAHPDLPRPGRPKLDAGAAKAAAARATGGRPGGTATLVMTAATGDVRLAWRVLRPQGSAYYDQLIDARSGEEISRGDRMTHAIPGTVHDHYPGAPAGGVARDVDLEPYLNPGATEPEGPRVRVYPDLNANDVKEIGETIPKTAGTFKYPRWPYQEPGCPAVGCAWSPRVANSYSTNYRQAGVQAFYFMNRYAEHLAAQPIGFDAFRDDLGDNDPIIGNVMNGAAGPNYQPMERWWNTAEAFVPPEGQSPILNFGLFHAIDKYQALDPADDASVVYHEYTHALIGRTVLDPLGWGALNLRQPWALNEGLSDFFAMDFLVGDGMVADTPAPGEVNLGAHLFKPGVGRKQALDCPVLVVHGNCLFQEMIPGGLSYGDYGQVDPRGPEPHYDGEILAQTMWQLRTELIAAYGQIGGQDRVRALAYLALRLAPPEPSFLDYRNALLEADLVLRQGQDSTRIWEVFADRGMGWYASTKDPDDDDPVADDTPGPAGANGQGTVSGIVTDRDTGTPLAGATVVLGGHTNKDGDFPGPFEATTDADGRFRIEHVPAGEYPHLIARRTGYAEQVEEDIDVRGATRADVRLRRNWADVNAGAAIAGTDVPQVNGCGAKHIADGNRFSGWAAILTGVDEAYVDVALPAPVRVTGFGIDPTPRYNEEVETNGRCAVHRGYRPARIVIEVAKEPGGPWQEAVRRPIDGADLHHLTEVRPHAPIDDVRFVRIRMIHPVDQLSNPRVLAFAELQVYAMAKRPPRAVFEYSPKPLDVDQAVKFDARQSRPGDADITRFEWDLDGNGSYETDTAGTPESTHSYRNTGNYNVGLRVTDADGEKDEFRTLVPVARDVEIFDLGTAQPDDGGSASAPQISRRGAVAVTTGHQGETDQMPGRYEGGSVRPLDLGPGKVFGTVWEVNDRDQAVGSVYPARVFEQVDAVLWNGSTPTVLGTLGGSSATAVGLNELGWVVGWAYDSSGFPRGYLKRAGNPMVDVQEEAGVPTTKRKTMKLIKINDAGVAVGCSDYERAGEGCGDAVVYDGMSRTLTTLPDLGQSAGATNISPDGRSVVGMMVDVGRIARATVWRDGQPQTVPVFGGDSLAMAINSHGTVTGHIGTLRGTGAWMFRDSKVTMLDTLVPDSGWQLLEADDINDRNEIVGYGKVDGKLRAYQLNLGPCRVCVKDVEVQDHDLPSGNWQAVGADGTVAGNDVRVRVRVANEDDQPHVFQLKARDETRKEAITDTMPTVSLDPGEEEWVELPWESTDGLAWKDGQADADHILRVRAVLGHTIFSGRSTVVKFRPRPVVLVPGALEDAAVWSTYADMLHRVNPDWEAHPVTGLQTGSWANLAQAPDTMSRHGEVLHAFVRAVRGEEDAEQIDLVAHGLGGIIARQWIQEGMPDDAVEHLIQLGTPNLGTPCAEIVDAGPFYDLRRDVMESFDGRITDRRGVKFSAYAGDVESYTCVRGTEGGDGYVPLSSARWTITDAATGEVAHKDMTGSGAVFSEFVKPRLTGEHAVPSAAAARSAAAEAPPEAGARSHQLLAQRIATVPAGGTVVEAIEVEGGSLLDVTLAAPPQVTAELVAPDGAVAARADGGTTRALTAEEPEPGRWLVRLRSTGAAPLQVALAAALRDDPWILELRRGRAGADGALPLIAAVTRFDRPVPEGAVTVELRQRGGAPQSVTLLDDGAHNDGVAGDGCFGGAPVVAPGETIVRLRVKRLATERLRTTWADIPAAGDEARVPQCPGRRGRNGEIAFSQHAEPTWGTVAPDGAIGTLPLHGQRVRDARWSPDGTRIAWSYSDDVYVAKADGTEPVLVAGGDDIERLGVDWSPDGTRLVYSRGCGGLATSTDLEACEVVMLDLATRQEQVVTAGIAPAWAPDGERLALVRRGDDGGLDSDIWTLRLEDGQLERVTSIGGAVDEPAWAPSGDRIVFSRYDSYSNETEIGTDQEIYIADAAGGGVRNLTNDDEACGETSCRGDMRDEAPTWSPDGRRIAFVSTRGEPIVGGRPQSSQVWEMRWDGTARRKRTSTPTFKLATTWRAVEYLEAVSPPRCFDLDVETLQDKVLRIPLDCVDDNGDQLTLQITEPPAHGTLSAVNDGGEVRYTPAAGFVGTDGFTFVASDALDTSVPARVAITVKAPPPPPPPPRPYVPPPMMGGGGGSGGGGGGSHDDDDDDGPVITIPGGCTVDPRTNSCIVTIPCQPGGDITGCTGRLTEAPSGRRATASAAAARARGRLMKTTRLRIPAGESRKVKLRLTRAGRAKLRAKRRLVIRVRVTIRAGGRVIDSHTERFVFKRRR